MRYKLNTQTLLNLIAADAPAEPPKISNHDFWAKQINQLYFIYPRFLLYKLNEKVRDQLYFPWEDPEGFEPLRVHLAVKYHWDIDEARRLNDEQLLDLLRPELRTLQLEAADVQGFESAAGDFAPDDLLQDLRSRSLELNTLAS